MIMTYLINKKEYFVIEWAPFQMYWRSSAIVRRWSYNSIATPETVKKKNLMLSIRGWKGNSADRLVKYLMKNESWTPRIADVTGWNDMKIIILQLKTRYKVVGINPQECHHEPKILIRLRNWQDPFLTEHLSRSWFWGKERIEYRMY